MAQPDTRRARILAAARRHLGRFGYRRAVLDDIAAEAGCAKGSLYLEFPNKEALFFAVLDDVQAELGARFAARVAGLTSAAAWVRTSLEFGFDALEREPLLARLLVDDPETPILRQYAAQARVQAEAAGALEHFRGLLRRGVAAGEFRADLDLDVVPFVLAGLKFLHAHLDLITAGMIDRRRYLEGLVAFVMAGLVAPAREPAA